MILYAPNLYARSDKNLSEENENISLPARVLSIISFLEQFP